jgi:hypothetical protein
MLRGSSGAGVMSPWRLERDLMHPGPVEGDERREEGATMPPGGARSAWHLAANGQYGEAAPGRPRNASNILDGEVT